MPLLLSIRNSTALLKTAKQHQTLNKKPSRKRMAFLRWRASKSSPLERGRGGQCSGGGVLYIVHCRLDKHTPSPLSSRESYRLPLFSCFLFPRRGIPLHQFHPAFGAGAGFIKS